MHTAGISKLMAAGGPAFPFIAPGDGGPEFVHPGMTARAYLAAKAMQGVLSAYDGHLPLPDPGYVAGEAIRYADALLARLNQQET